MHPLILIGLDFAFSAVLILLVLHLTWGRLRMVLEAQGIAPRAPLEGQASERTDSAEKSESASPRETVAVGDMASQAESLRREGHSVEDIASRLQSPRGEIEMILALSAMGRTVEPEEAPGPVVPSPKRKITELLRF